MGIDILFAKTNKQVKLIANKNPASRPSMNESESVEDSLSHSNRDMPRMSNQYLDAEDDQITVNSKQMMSSDADSRNLYSNYNMKSDRSKQY